MSENSLKLPSEHTLSTDTVNRLQKDIDEARSYLHRATLELHKAKRVHVEAEDKWKKACLALPSLIYHTDTKIYELVEKDFVLQYGLDISKNL